MVGARIGVRDDAERNRRPVCRLGSVAAGPPAVVFVADRSQIAYLAPLASDEVIADVSSGAKADVLTAGPGVEPLPGVAAAAAVPIVHETAAVSDPAASTA